MDIVLWIGQVLLAGMFAMAGSMKLMKSRQQIIESGMAYAEDLSDNILKGIGALEVAGALGMILPMALDILPVLTPLAGLGLALTMVGAFFDAFAPGRSPARKPVDDHEQCAVCTSDFCDSGPFLDRTRHLTDAPQKPKPRRQRPRFFVLAAMKNYPANICATASGGSIVRLHISSGVKPSAERRRTVASSGSAISTMCLSGS